MSQSTTSASPASIAVDLILTGAVFVGMFFWVRPHVASEDIQTINFWGAFSSVSVAGTFWLALQMFKVVYRHQKASCSKN